MSFERTKDIFFTPSQRVSFTLFISIFLFFSGRNFAPCTIMYIKRLDFWENSDKLEKQSDSDIELKVVI